jgi:hypothetical protein
MFLVAIFILGLLVMLLWNALIPVLFHGPEVTYWQAIGLLLLTRILVGIRGRRGFLHGLWHWKKWGAAPWRWKRRGWRWEDAMFGPGRYPRSGRGHWQGMNDEERRQAKEVWKEKIDDYCGPWFGKWQDWQNMSPEERQQAKEDWKRKKEEWKSAWKNKEGT